MDEITPEIFRIAGYSILRWNEYSIVLDVETVAETTAIPGVLYYTAQEEGGRKVRSHAVVLPRDAPPDQPRRAKLNFSKPPTKILCRHITTDDGKKIPLNTRITQQYAHVYKIEPA